jgi:glucokinase
MAAVAILVNGLPGAGKTTLGRELAGLLGCPLISKDAIAEPLGTIAGPMIPPSTLGGIAMDTLWAMAGAVEAGVVLDAVWLAGRDESYLRDGLTTAGSPRVVEVWCEVSDEVAEDRLRSRPNAESSIAWRAAHAGAAPMGIAPVVRVDTSADIDMPELVQEIAAHFV